MTLKTVTTNPSAISKRTVLFAPSTTTNSPKMTVTLIKNRSIGPELTTAKTGPIHLSSLVEIAFVD